MVVAAAALVTGLLLVIAYGTTRLAPAPPAGGPGTTPVPSAGPPSSAAPSTAPSTAPPPAATVPPSGREADAPGTTPPRHPAGKKKRAHHRKHASRPRHHRPVRRPHRPVVRRPPRPVRPAAPPWITRECKRRYPFDPTRSAACAGTLSGVFGR